MPLGEIMTAVANVVLVVALVTVFLRYMEVYYRFAKQIKEKQGKLLKKTLIKIALLGASLAVLASIITLCIITESIVFLNPEFTIIEIIRLGIWGIVILIIGSVSLQALILSAFLRKIFGKTGCYLETFFLSIRLAMKPLLLDMIWLPVILVILFHFYPVHIVISDLILRLFISLDLYIPPVVIFMITGAVLGYILLSSHDYGYTSLLMFLFIPLVSVGGTIILDRALKVNPLAALLFILILILVIPALPDLLSRKDDTRHTQYTTIEEIRGMLKYTGLALVILYLIHRFGTEVLVSAYTSFIKLIKSISIGFLRDLFLTYFANRGAIAYAYCLATLFADWGNILFVIGVIFVIIGVVKKAPVPLSFRIKDLKATMVTYSVFFSLTIIAPSKIGVEILNNLLCMNEACSVFIWGIVLIFSLYLINASIIKMYYVIRSIIKESRVEQQEISSS